MFVTIVAIGFAGVDLRGVKAKLANLGLVVVAGKPEELANVVKEALKVRGELVKAAGIQPE